MFKKIQFTKSLVFWKKNKNRIYIKFWTFVLSCYTWNAVNTNWRMKYFFVVFLKYSSTKFQQHQHWYSKTIQKKFLYLHEMGQQIKSSLLIKRCCSKFILTSAFIYLQSSFLFQHGKKAMRIYIILLHILIPVITFVYYHLFLAFSSTFMTDSR